MPIATAEKLEKIVQKNRQEIKSDRMDMSFGEIINMYEDEEIIISPAYQRAFRWTPKNQTKFIESVLLGIPFPPIFVAEDEDNVWELVDGLQRLSTILAFFGKLKNSLKNNLKLSEGSIVAELDGYTIKTIPLKYKLLLKRAVCRVEIIRADSEFDMKYELFKRLNTGGLTLSPQEIRNCVYRADNNQFNGFVEELSSMRKFRNIVQISEQDSEKMQYEELVLRYLSLKNRKKRFGTNIQNHFDNYMKEIVTGLDKIDYEKEKELFKKIIAFLYKSDKNIFKMSNRKFSTSVFDTLMIVISEDYKYFSSKGIEYLEEKIPILISNPEFRKNAGSASSSQTKINGKIKIAKEVFELR